MVFIWENPSTMEEIRREMVEVKDEPSSPDREENPSTMEEIGREIVEVKDEPSSPDREVFELLSQIRNAELDEISLCSRNTTENLTLLSDDEDPQPAPTVSPSRSSDVLHGEKPFACGQCDCNSSQHTPWMAHLEKCHVTKHNDSSSASDPSESNSAPIVTGKPILKMPLPDADTDLMLLLKGAENIPLLCTACQVHFEDQEAYKRHFIEHIRFACGFCDSVFVDVDSLANHTKIHFASDSSGLAPEPAPPAHVQEDPASPFRPHQPPALIDDPQPSMMDDRTQQVVKEPCFLSNLNPPTPSTISSASHSQESADSHLKMITLRVSLTRSKQIDEMAHRLYNLSDINNVEPDPTSNCCPSDGQEQNRSKKRKLGDVSRYELRNLSLNLTDTAIIPRSEKRISKRPDKYKVCDKPTKRITRSSLGEPHVQPNIHQITEPTDIPKRCRSRSNIHRKTESTDTPKRGRGRPNVHQKTESTDTPKRGRGRPRKQPPPTEPPKTGAVNIVKEPVQMEPLDPDVINNALQSVLDAMAGVLSPDYSYDEEHPVPSKAADLLTDPLGLKCSSGSSISPHHGNSPSPVLIPNSAHFYQSGSGLDALCIISPESADLGIHESPVSDSVDMSPPRSIYLGSGDEHDQPESSSSTESDESTQNPAPSNDASSLSRSLPTSTIGSWGFFSDDDERPAAVNSVASEKKKPPQSRSHLSWKDRMDQFIEVCDQIDADTNIGLSAAHHRQRAASKTPPCPPEKLHKTPTRAELVKGVSLFFENNPTPVEQSPLMRSIDVMLRLPKSPEKTPKRLAFRDRTPPEPSSPVASPNFTPPPSPRR